MNEKNYKKISAYETISNPDSVDVIPTVHTQPDGRKINRNIPFSALKGDVGPQGPEGPKGDQGDIGPKGDKGDKGDTGSAATVAVGSTTTGNAGTNAIVTNSGSSSAAVLNFTIPRGPQGLKGDKGDKGDQGDQGPQGIQGPKGDQGEQGPEGPQGEQGIKGDTGAGVNIIGTLNDPSELPASGSTSDAYLIDGSLYVWTGDSWENVGSIQGPEGPQGPKGDTGDAGAGVATGGSAGQILSKNSATNYDTAWVDPPTSGVWGQITGTLSNQTDLNTALAGKANSSHTHSTTDLTATGGTSTSFLRKDNTWATPTNTTYSEITSAEITAGTASTARAISGRRAQEIVNKAQTGVVKSATTDRITVAATAPSSPQGGDIWYDTSEGSETSLFSQFMDKVYPVGSLYFNADNDTNPGVLLGVGEWEAYAQGRVPVGKADSGTFSTAGDTMGAETHTLTVAQMPSHNHDITGGSSITGGQIRVGNNAASGSISLANVTSTTTYTPYGIANAGGGDAHNNIQPSIVVHIWRRIS